MQSNSYYILSYLYMKRCICCWYFVGVLLCKPLTSYKMFWDKYTYHRVTFSTVKSSRPYARIQRWQFRFGWDMGSKKHLSCVHIWISTIAYSIGTVSCSAVGFLFSPSKFYFHSILHYRPLQYGVQTGIVCTTFWNRVWLIIRTIYF